MVQDRHNPNKLAPMVIKKMHDNSIKLGSKKIIIIIISIIVIFFMWLLLKKPSVTLIGDKVEKVSYKSEFIDSGIKAKYHGKDVTNTVV